MDNSMEIKFRATLLNEGLARIAVVQFINYLHPTMETIGEIKTIISEAVSNAIIHGYKMDDSKDVFLRATVEKDVLEIVVTDFGKGIEDLELAKKPHYTTRPDLERAGMGVTIIDTLSDEFILRSVVNMGTKVIVKKKIHCTNLNEEESGSYIK